MDYRIHVTIRRKGKPVFTSQEFKTEEYDSLVDAMASATEFVIIQVYDDKEYDNDDDARGSQSRASTPQV